jgi:hypothetical protein
MDKVEGFRFYPRKGKRTHFFASEYVSPSLVSISDAALAYLDSFWADLGDSQGKVVLEGEHLQAITIGYADEISETGSNHQPIRTVRTNAVTVGLDKFFEEAGTLAVQRQGYQLLFATKRSADQTGACEIGFDGTNLTIRFVDD